MTDDRNVQPVIKIKRLGITPSVRQVHTSKKARTRALTTDALHPQSTNPRPGVPEPPETVPKGRALSMIEDAGYDSRDFAKGLDVLVSMGIVKRDGQQYVIPKAYVEKHIKKLEADRG
jgi:hypothetical protein